MSDKSSRLVAIIDEYLAERRRGAAPVRSDLLSKHPTLAAELDDRELLESAVFEWAGPKYPVRRWLSLNTSRQYETARTLIRRTLRTHR